MAVNYRTSLKTARMTDVVNDIDSGAGAGTLEIGDAGFANVLAIFTCSDPCGTVGTDTLTFSGMPKSTTGLVAGVAGVARFKNSTGTIIVSGLTVGTSGSDIIISPSTSIALAQAVDWTAGTIQHSA